MQKQRLTRAKNHLVAALGAIKLPAVTPYKFFRLLEAVYREGQSLYLKLDQPMLSDYLRIVKNLVNAKQIRRDNDYSTRAFG